MTSFLNNAHKIVGPERIVRGMAAVKKVLRLTDGCRAFYYAVVRSDGVQKGNTDEVLRTPVRSRRQWLHQARAGSLAANPT